jgi:hypothetical protein
MGYDLNDVARGKRADEQAAKPCRMDQLFAASTRVINKAREAAFQHAAGVDHGGMADLRAALDVFDRLNGGI